MIKAMPVFLFLIILVPLNVNANSIKSTDFSVNCESLRQIADTHSKDRHQIENMHGEWVLVHNIVGGTGRNSYDHLNNVDLFSPISQSMDLLKVSSRSRVKTISRIQKWSSREEIATENMEKLRIVNLEFSFFTANGEDFILARRVDDHFKFSLCNDLSIYARNDI